MGNRRLIAVDCETDPFLNERVPKPFIWGSFDGKRQLYWTNTDDFVAWLSRQYCYAYAHNGGKFDFMYLMKYLKSARASVIGGRIAEINFGKAKLRDSFSIIPKAMGSIEKTKIDYWTFEEKTREAVLPEIKEYLKDDCQTLYKMVDTYRKTAGTQLTIASNAMKSARKLGIKTKKTNFRFDREFREYYFGGRTECLQPGTHDDLIIVDIVSSYPFAMMQPHPTGDTRITARDKAPKLAKELLENGEIGPCFIDLECYSNGAFPLRSEDGSLEFPHKFARYKVTGWEYEIAKKHGLIRKEKILSLTQFENTIDFTPYIDKWFKYKKSWDKKKNPIEYTIGKIMLNSLYGKMAQDPTRYFDYEFHESGTTVNEDEGWQLYTENFMGLEVHRRSAMWKFEKKYGVDWNKNIGIQFFEENDDEEFLVKPRFYNVATGASITGFARARLLDAAHKLGIDNLIYCDTDSLMLHNCDVSALKLSGDLGAWEIEGRALRGHFAGKKLYAVKLDEIDKENGGNIIKIASKGCKITYDEMQAEINSLAGKTERKEYNKDLGFERMERLVNGEEIKIINPAPNFSIAHGTRFVPRYIRATSRVAKRE